MHIIIDLITSHDEKAEFWMHHNYIQLSVMKCILKTNCKQGNMSLVYFSVIVIQFAEASSLAYKSVSS